MQTIIFNTFKNLTLNLQALFSLEIGSLIGEENERTRKEANLEA